MYATTGQLRKNGNRNTTDVQTASYVEFVKRHQATLNYMLKFGNATERAKAETLIELAEGLK